MGTLIGGAPGQDAAANEMDSVYLPFPLLSIEAIIELDVQWASAAAAA